MRLSPPPPLRRKGRYLLLLAALLLLWLGRGLLPAGGLAALHPLPLVTSSPAALGSAAGGRADPACVTAPPSAAAPPPPAGLSGQLGLYVAVIDPATLAPLRAVSVGENGVFPLASTYKQAVLWALLRDVDAGTLSMTDTFDVDPGTQSLGNYPFDHSSVSALAERMIHNSDNTATDLLHRRVGLAAVQRVADDLKLCHTRLLLPTKAWWTAQAGLSPSFPGAAHFAALTGAARLGVAEALAADALKVRSDVLQRKLDDYFEHRYVPDADLGTQNVSTPYELSVLLAHEFLNSGLSPRQQQIQRDLMATGFGRSRLRAPIQYFGGKGGNGWRLLTYSGYVQTRGGEHVVYAFMQHGADQTYTMPNTGRAFAWINAAIGEVLLPGDGVSGGGGASGEKRSPVGAHGP